jgi:hypothetical protein
MGLTASEWERWCALKGGWTDDADCIDLSPVGGAVEGGVRFLYVLGDASGGATKARSPRRLPKPRLERKLSEGTSVV